SIGSISKTNTMASKSPNPGTVQQVDAVISTDGLRLLLRVPASRRERASSTQRGREAPVHTIRCHPILLPAGTRRIEIQFVLCYLSAAGSSICLELATRACP